MVTDARAPITVLIAVSVQLYREGLAATLDAQDRLRVLGSVGSPIEALATVRELVPEVVIIDVTLEDVHGLFRALREQSPGSRLLAFAVEEDLGVILEYAGSGADGFFTAGGSVAELVEAIERIRAGELLCSPRLAAELLRRAARPASIPAAAGHVLTGRERQVYSLLRQGRSNKEIASALHIAEATVKNHVHHLLEKFQMTTRGQVAASGTLAGRF